MGEIAEVPLQVELQGTAIGVVAGFGTAILAPSLAEASAEGAGERLGGEE